MRAIRISLMILLLITAFGCPQAEAQKGSTQSFNIGYFEAGPYPVHSLVRAEFYSQLEQIIPDNYRFVTIPQGFRSAEWKRDQCRTMARELVDEKSVDIVIALGPWVVHDLLEAGFDRPIIAMHQFEPTLEGLMGKDGKPIAPNLTVHVKPGKLYEDLTILSRLVDLKRLGFLYFPSAEEKDAVLDEVKAIGERLGFEVVTAEGFDNYGTFAFFKSFSALDKEIDAVYLPPLWGLKTTNLAQFLQLISDAGIPAFTSEGKLILEKGAFATASFYSAVSEARYNAAKAVRIMQGETPADLPAAFRGGLGLAVNNATALACDIDLPEEVLSDFYVVEAPVSGEVSYFTINDAVNRAAGQNPGYLKQHETLEAAAQAASQAYSEYLPQIYSITQLTHLDDNSTHNWRDLISNDYYRTSLRFEQQVFSLETIREIQAASSRHDMEQINVTRAQLDLELAVSLAFLNHLRSEEILSAIKANRSLIEHNLELAESRAQLGEGDTLDVIRLEDERYQATLRVIDARANLKISRVVLNALFNLPGNEPLVLDSVTFAEPSFLVAEAALGEQVKNAPAQAQLENKLIDQALALNPGTQKVHAAIQLQKDLMAKNSARFWPSIGLQASLNFSDWLEESQTFEEKNTTWSISGFLRLPIFNGSDRFRQRSRLKAQLSELEYQQDEVSLEIMKNVQTNLHLLVAAVTRITPTFQSRKRSTQTLNLVIPGFSSGDVELIDLMDAQQNALDAEINAIAARYSYYEALARLVHSVGWTVADDYSSFIEEFHRRLVD